MFVYHSSPILCYCSLSVFFLNGNMNGCVDVYLHQCGRWIIDYILHYVEGDVHIVEDFDVDFLFRI